MSPSRVRHNALCVTMCHNGAPPPNQQLLPPRISRVQPRPIPLFQCVCDTTTIGLSAVPRLQSFPDLVEGVEVAVRAEGRARTLLCRTARGSENATKWRIQALCTPICQPARV